MTRIDRTGEVGYNKYGSKMVIIEYNKSDDIIVEFEKGNRVHTRYCHFKKGSVANVYDRTVYGVGYYGEGKYVAKINEKHTPQYKAWNDMMIRAYSNKLKNKFETYKEVKACEEWHNFQNFAKWYDENIYHVKSERMHLDKDILVKGNKIYSPDTCIFVPQRINSLFIKCNKERRRYPIGVSYYKRSNKYAVDLNKDGKSVRLGYYATPEEGFYVYKKAKEDYIKQVADEYKPYIPKILYDALYKYKVDISD